MKKTIIFVISLFITIGAQAQSSVENMMYQYEESQRRLHQNDIFTPIEYAGIDPKAYFVVASMLSVTEAAAAIGLAAIANSIKIYPKEARAIKQAKLALENANELFTSEVMRQEKISQIVNNSENWRYLIFSN